MDDALRELARDAGIANEWTDAFGQPQRVSIESLRSILTALGLPCATAGDVKEGRAKARQLSGGAQNFVTATTGKTVRLPEFSGAAKGELFLESGERRAVALRVQRGRTVAPAISEPGYHRLRVADREIMFAIAPPRCITLDDIAPGEKLWGIGAQLYALRGKKDRGIGDVAALRELVASGAGEGADAIALSPTHSLFAADSSHYGPYSPSNRLFLNPLYADPSVIFGEARVVAADTDDHAPAPSEGLIDWPKVAPAKYRMLRRLYDDFAANELQRSGEALARDFSGFAQEGGDRLREHALFEALHGHWFSQPDAKWYWNDWPQDWRSPSAPAAMAFADARSREIEFHVFLQWITARSFAAAQQDARRQGMRIGLVSDIAVGTSPGGSHAWSRPHDLLPNLSVGAPPDLINTRGQDWGLTAFSPRGLAATGFEPFIATLRAAMRHAGGVRIDHVMGLARLWLVPRGASSTEGAYLSYPLDDMLRLIALESHRHRAIVIGEDLGTVQPEFRERLSASGISGMDVLWFQRSKQEFLPPTKWRREAVAMTTTHDLPTVAGWWSGADIEMRAGLGLADEAKEPQERTKDRTALWSAFEQAGVVEKSSPPSAVPGPVVDAAIDFTAQSPASLALIPIEDILGVAEQPNLPGTIDEHPNWRRRVGKPASEIFAETKVQKRLQTLRERKRK